MTHEDSQRLRTITEVCDGVRAILRDFRAEHELLYPVTNELQVRLGRMEMDLCEALVTSACDRKARP